MFKAKRNLKKWEAALLCAFALSLLASCWAQGRQRALADGLIRLHVIAVDDSESEQALKLRVRDAVLAYLEPKLDGAADADEAAGTLASELEGIRAAAESASEGRGVAVALGQERYPLRQYGDFALPAGEYRSLRVTIGEGEGRNWWCVVFPPLCLRSAESPAVQSVMNVDDLRLIRQDEGYELRFRVLELWGEMKAWLAERRA